MNVHTLPTELQPIAGAPDLAAILATPETGLHLDLAARAAEREAAAAARIAEAEQKKQRRAIANAQMSAFATEIKQFNAERKSNSIAIARKFAEHAEEAAEQLVALTTETDSKSVAGQVRACESVLNWACDQPKGTFISATRSIEGLPAKEAIRVVIDSAWEGECSLEAAEAFVKMLKLEDESLVADEADKRLAELAEKTRKAQGLAPAQSLPTPGPAIVRKAA